MLRWRRWIDGLLLALAVVFESTTFVICSFIVGRHRPPVVRLDTPAPSGSFPSGHAAAAVAFYVTLSLIVRWHAERRDVRAMFAVIAALAPIAVATSRVYRGMHYPLDSVAGLVLGAVSIAVVWRVLAGGAGSEICVSSVTIPRPRRHR